MAKILVVEDDQELSLMVTNWLTMEHHTVEVVPNGDDAIRFLRTYQFDMLILDWELPGMSGVEICQQFRISGGSIPILMLTGKSALNEKEEGFEAGVDDYLTKPFQLKELSMRVKALMRRTSVNPTSVLTIGKVSLYPDTHKVICDGKEAQLHPKEFGLLEFLMRHPGQVFSPEALLNHVWSSYSDASPESIRAYITKLRAKIAVEDAPSIIKTVHGIGYKVEDA